VVDQIDDCNCCFAAFKPSATESVGKPRDAYALPFFELIKSAISRSRARFGSKFWDRMRSLMNGGQKGLFLSPEYALNTYECTAAK
jgi:hypothetical protein